MMMTNLHTDPCHPRHTGECLRLFLCKLSSQAVALNAYSPFFHFYFQTILLYSNSVCILFDFYFRDFLTLFCRSSSENLKPSCYLV